MDEWHTRAMEIAEFENNERGIGGDSVRVDELPNDIRDKKISGYLSDIKHAWSMLGILGAKNEENPDGQ